MKSLTAWVFIASSAATAFAQVQLPTAQISTTVSPGAIVGTGQVVTVGFRLGGYAGSTEAEGFNFIVSYDSSLLEFVPGSIYLGAASGSDQQWLSKGPQEDAAGGHYLTNGNNALIPGYVFAAVGDIGRTYPRRGTLALSGFLMSFQLRALSPGVSSITISPEADGSVLLNTSLRPFGNVELAGADIVIVPASELPTVNLTAPTEGAIFNMGTKITLTAAASSPNATVTNVEFFAEGTNTLGQATIAPYTIDWTNAAPGARTLTAKATDSLGRFAFSAPVHITVNQPPSVAITNPVAGASFNAPASIPIGVSASDSDGSVTQVTFYAGTTLLSTDTTSPYAFTWSNVSTGSYTLTARAVDNRGATNVSVTVPITVRPSNNVPTIVAVGALVESESGPVNGGLDAGETVTIRFFLRNTGGSDVASLTGTLAASGGVVSPSAAQSYGTVPFGGAPVGRSYSFSASGSPGGTVTATLWLTNAGASLGSVTFSFTLGNSATYALSQINIPSGPGAASPYPSAFSVSGLSGLVDKATVTFSNLSHTFPADIDALLTGAGGRNVMLMSDAGLSYVISNKVVTFDDAAASSLPNNAAITTGTYRPTDYETGDIMPSPAPSAPFGTNLAVFRGQDPNTTWSLYVADDASGDLGKIQNGWLLSLITFDPVNPVSDISVTVTDAPDPVGYLANVTYTVTVINVGPEGALNVLLTNQLSAGLSFVSASAGQGSCSNSGSTVTCDLGYIGSGNSAVVTVTASAQTTATKTLTASVGGPSVDFNSSNNSSSASTIVSGSADLALTVTDIPDPAATNSTLTYTLVVTNRGFSSATSVTLTSALPAGVTFQSAAPGGSCSQSGGVVTCGLGTVAANASSAVFINVTTPSTFGLLTMQAGVSAGAPGDPVSGNNTVTTVTTNLNTALNIVPALAFLLTESGPVNGGVEPGETVTMAFYLKNVGTTTASSLTAGLLASGGVTSPGATMNYGSLTAGGVAVARTNTFTTSGSPGGTVTASLVVTNSGQWIGTVNFTFILGGTYTFANITAAITIPEFGAATPYPSTITVSGLNGMMGKTTVVLTNFVHTYPDDVDILLVAPDGWSALLLSDAGGGNAVAGVTLGIDDAATNSVPDRFTITNGLYRPTNFDTSDSLPSPAPAGGYGTNLSTFTGGALNGVWSLYVYDDFFSDTGSLGGWSLTLTTVGIVKPRSANSQPGDGYDEQPASLPSHRHRGRHLQHRSLDQPDRMVVHRHAYTY